MILWEAALAALGLYVLVTGQLRVMGRAIRGRRAREVGLILIAPLALALILALGLGALLAPGDERLPDDVIDVLSLIEFALVAAAVGAASYLVFASGQTLGKVWHAKSEPGADPSPGAPQGRMTVAQAAQALELSELEVLALIRTGALPGVRAGLSYHVDRRAVERLRRQRGGHD